METMNLSDCTYEHIKKTFYYGIFGDFKLVIDKSTGYFNATKLCDQGGKIYRNWSRLEKSRNMIEYYQKNRRSDLSAGFENWGKDSSLNLIYEVKGDNNNKLNKQFTGTYVPKELILDIASWVSIEFYDKCNSIIINYFVNQYKSLSLKMLQRKIQEADEKMVQLTLEKTEELKVKDDKIDELKQLMVDMNLTIKKQEEDRKKDRQTMERQEQTMERQEQYMRSLGISLEEVKDQNEELLDETKGLKKQNKSIQRKLNIAVEDRAPLPADKKRQERFVLLKRNDPDYTTYYVIRAQHDYTSRKLKTERLHFPNLEVLLDFKCSPNSKTLYTRIKEDLTSKGVLFKRNNISLENTIITEEELKEAMKVINDSRKDI